MTPIVDGLESEFKGQAMVYQLNADEGENALMQQQFGLRGHPTFVVLDGNGRALQTFIGPQTTAVLREALAAAVASDK
jgi:thioredoxin-like negative regulator of GroEL